MRYWKGAFDEDNARDVELRRAYGVAEDEHEGDMRWFQVLVAIQVLLVSLVGLLFLSSR